MATRTNRLIGKVWGDPANPATVVVNYNGQEVFNGPVTTTAGAADAQIPAEDMEILCSWTGDSAVNGSIPVSIAVLNGTAVINTITMNQCRELAQTVEKPDAVWPAYHPTSNAEVHLDRMTLSAADFLAKYGAPSSIAYTNYDTTVLASMADHFMTPIGASVDATADNKFDVALNGTPWPVDPSSLNGLRSYDIDAGKTLTFNYSVIVQG